jgi:hypothetical protein
MKRFLGFAGRVTVAHVVTYIAVGALAYPLLTREFFEGSAGLAAQVMRTPAEPALWAHVTRWMLPFQVLRGVLIALVLYPFLGTITRWSYAKRLAAIAGLYIVLGQWASTVAGSGTIEGWLILRPEFTSPNVVVKAMGEGLVQGLALSAWVARWVMSLPGATAERAASAGAGGPTTRGT